MTQKKSPPPSLPALPVLPARPATPNQIEASLDARLDFTPVPRAAKRWNGLTDLKQRTFIQLLADSGSVTMAAKAIGTTTSAMYSLRRGEGAESFPEKYGSATGLMDLNGMSHAMQKLKAKWEGEWREKYDAEQAANAEAEIEAQEAVLEAERRELLPVVLVKMYQRKVREERKYRLGGNVMSADVTLRQLTHLELYMEYAGLTEPEINQFFDQAATDPFPWETEASRAISAHRIAAWAMDGECENDPLLRPTPLSYGPKGPPHHAMRGGENMRERIHARDQAEAQMAEAQRLWEACATEESWEGFSTR